MAGNYRTSFEFLETIAFVPGYKLDRPYQSWATEVVDVLEDTPRKIVLQHVLVMYIKSEGKVLGPFVMKHWRQDWIYEDNDLHVYVGNNTWERRRPAADLVKGKWSQAVYQVDDSPRYEALGLWSHDGGVSSWRSELTWRPLPRREHTVRSDYNVLIGENRHTLTPSGWTHEEDNVKAIWAAAKPIRYLAHELGLNRYQLLAKFDKGPATEYLAKTNTYWTAVRDTWKQIYERCEQFTLREKVLGKLLYERHFAEAEAFTQKGASAEVITKTAQQTIYSYLASCQQPSPRSE